jgi:gamma-glutamylputrescine oxidase
MPRYGLSPWEDRARHARVREWPRFAGERTADVVVAGGGLTGALVALLAAKGGRQVVLLEAGRTGLGATAAAQGLLLPWPRTSFAELRQRYGLRDARVAFEASRTAASGLQALLRRLRVRCGLDSGDYLQVALSSAAAAELQRDFRELEQAGIPARWLEGASLAKQVGTSDARAAMRAAGAATVDPFAAAMGVIRAAAGAKARIFERSAVTGISAGRANVVVETEAGRVRADVLVVATGEPGPLHSQLARHVDVSEEYGVAVELSASVARSAGNSGVASVADTERPPHAWRRDGNRLLFLGGAQPPVPRRGRDQALVQRGGQLMYELSLLYPAISGLRPSHVWAAPTRRAPDGLPYAGPHRNYPRQLFALACDTSLSASLLAAGVVVRHILGTAGKSDEVFGFLR